MHTTRISVDIQRPFLLQGFDEQPAGHYIVDLDEEPIDGLTFLARRRVGAILYVPAGSDPGTCRHALPLTIAELDAVAPPKDGGAAP